jgi:hypothetical protein
MMKVGEIGKSKSRLSSISLLRLTSVIQRGRLLTCRKFQALWKEYHAENKAINSQPPTSANYLLRMYPNSLERDALLQEQETMWDYKCVTFSRSYPETRLIVGSIGRMTSTKMNEHLSRLSIMKPRNRLFRGYSLLWRRGEEN